MGCSCQGGETRTSRIPRPPRRRFGPVARSAAATQPFAEPFPVPEYPPIEWFTEDPTEWVEEWRAEHGLGPAVDHENGIYRLTVTDEGRIGGLFFEHGQCLVHDVHACPGPSPTNYAAFHQSDVVVEGGKVLRCGVIGMTHGHASPWLDWKEAQRHYADPTAQMILCRAGDNERGGWIAGAVIPGMTWGDVALMRRSALSGDWRPMPQSWWRAHGISAAAVKQAEGYDCIGPTLVTRPALPLVSSFAASVAPQSRAASILSRWVDDAAPRLFGPDGRVPLTAAICGPHDPEDEEDEARTAAGNPDALREWFNSGADGQIEWGEHGAFDACVALASEHMDEEQARGFCAERHHDAVGKWPGAKAAMTASVANDLRSLAQELAMGQHRARVKPGKAMSALHKAAAYLDREDTEKAAAALDRAIKAVQALERQSTALAGLTARVRGLAEEALPGRSAAMARRAYSEDQRRDNSGRWTVGGGGGGKDDEDRDRDRGRGQRGDRARDRTNDERKAGDGRPVRTTGNPDVDRVMAEHPRKAGEDLFAWQGRVVSALEPDLQNEVLFAVRERYEPVQFLADGVNQWCEEKGIGAPPLDEIAQMRVDAVEAEAVARFFEETPDQADDPKVQQAYEEFKAQSEEMFDFLTRPESEGGLGVKVEFTDQVDPYASAADQAADLQENRHLWIESGLGGDHSATMTTEEYDRFRAVHDAFGHASVGNGFDRHGEYQAWLVHATMYEGLGREAMSTEYHGVNSAMWSGEPGSPGTGKSVLLPDQYGVPPWERTATVAMPEDTPVEVAEIVRALGLDSTFAQQFDHPSMHPEVQVKKPETKRAALFGPTGRVAAARRAYTEAQPRDEHGRWTSGGSTFDGGSGGEGGGKGPVNGPPTPGTGSEIADRFIGGEKGIVLDVDEVATFTDRLAEFGLKEKEEGRGTRLNLCEVEVPGTNLFCGDNQGIPRQEMPQLIGKPTPGSPAEALVDEKGEANITAGFLDSLRAGGAKFTEDKVPSASLKSTQSELVGEKVAGIAKAIRDGKLDIEGGDRIIVSKDNYILDGHHRWGGAILNDAEDGRLGDSQMPIYRVDMGILDLVKAANDYADEQGIAQKGTKQGSVRRVRRGSTVRRANTEVTMSTGTRVELPDGTVITTAPTRAAARRARATRRARAAATAGAADLPLAPPETPFDRDAATQRIMEWATGPDGAVDWDKVAQAHFFVDPTKDAATPEAYMLQFGDVIDGTLVAVPAAIEDVAQMVAGVNGGKTNIPDADKEAVKGKVDGYYAKMAAEFDDGTIVPPWTAASVDDLESGEMLSEDEMEGEGGDIESRVAALEERVSALEEFASMAVEAQVAALMASETPLPEHVSA